MPGQLTLAWARAWGEPPVSGSLRSRPEDFEVTELLGFEPEGEGEHLFLYLEKRERNTADTATAIARWAGVPLRSVGFSGLKDRNALTRQWFSVALPGRPDPDPSLLEDGQLRLLQAARHRRKLRRGAHRGNHFRLRLRSLQGDLEALGQRLQLVRDDGVPNYFGEQRFGVNGSNLQRAMLWLRGESAAPRRQQRGYCLSALRAWLFNALLSQRVAAGSWRELLPGDVCMLHGSRSLFGVAAVDAELGARLARGDVHPALPLWGLGEPPAGSSGLQGLRRQLVAQADIMAFLEARELALDWRPGRCLADDFCWEFCDDETLMLEFSLGPGSYATALLRELANYNDISGRENQPS